VRYGELVRKCSVAGHCTFSDLSRGLTSVAGAFARTLDDHVLRGQTETATGATTVDGDGRRLVRDFVSVDGATTKTRSERSEILWCVTSGDERSG